MTPNIKKLFQHNNIFIELSEGFGIEHKKIYGISKIDFINNEFKTDIDSNLNKCFSSLRLAENHFLIVIAKIIK